MPYSVGDVQLTTTTGNFIPRSVLVGLITFRVKPVVSGQVRGDTRYRRAYSLHSQDPGRRRSRVRGGTAMLADLAPQVVRSVGPVVGNSVRMKSR